jgi:RimJ/RimL family protein N-acetyltransferase
LGASSGDARIATAALELLLSEIPERPLFATVAEHNTGSLRVLEKCGFERRGSGVADDGVTEIRLALAG